MLLLPLLLAPKSSVSGRNSIRCRGPNALKFSNSIAVIMHSPWGHPPPSRQVYGHLRQEAIRVARHDEAETNAVVVVGLQFRAVELPK
jgi:hypothetical protein